MPDITVIFKNHRPLHIKLYDTTAAHQWKQLFLNNYQREFPIFRDMQQCTLARLEQLIQQVNQTCGWNFTEKIESLENTLALHRHIEVTLSNGCNTVPRSWFDLIDELHFTLHTLEQNKMSRTPRRGNFLQIEWFDDEFVPLPDDFVFTDIAEFGSVRLQNAYVGHPPLMIHKQNDHANVFQTCRFHDRIKPGLHIMTAKARSDGQSKEYIDSDYQNWWTTHAPEFVAQHGMDKIMYYTGYPLIGKVINVHELERINRYPGVLELQEVIVH
jgi:hypothetical protein